MVHIETQKVKVLRANQKNAKLLSRQSKGLLGFGFWGAMRLGIVGVWDVGNLEFMSFMV